MRCTGHFHLGHFFLLKQVKSFLDQNKDYEVIFLLADRHGIIQHFLPNSCELLKNKHNIYSSVLDIIKTLVSFNFSTQQIIISSYLNSIGSLL